MNEGDQNAVASANTSWDFLVICGPTASGKTSLALHVAAHTPSEIIGCDSIQVYKGFDIGSAKPDAAERRAVPHHLVDLVHANEEFDTGVFGPLARQKLEEIQSRKHLPIVVGGSGLYLQALLGNDWHGQLPRDDTLRATLQSQETEQLYEQLKSLDSVRASEVHPNDRFRVVRALELVTLLGKPVRELPKAESILRARAYIVVIIPERRKLHEAIAWRTKKMLSDGLLTEVKGLLAEGIDPECKPMKSVGYRQCVEVLRGLESIDGMEDRINAASRQYAKRQITWFKSIGADEVVEDSGDPMWREGFVERMTKTIGASLR